MSEIQKEEKMQEISPAVIKPFTCKPRSSYKRCLADLGDRYMIKAKLSIVDGKKIAEPGNKLDLYAYIQAQVASTDMASIVARVKAGDLDAINVNPNGYYGDATILPKDIQDVHAMNKMYESAIGAFNKLDPEVKALFDNNSDKFLNALISKQAEGIYGDYLAKKAKQQPAAPEEPKGE